MEQNWLQGYVNYLLPKTFTEDELKNSCINIANDFNTEFKNNDPKYISRYDLTEKVLYLPINFQLAFSLIDDNRTIKVGIFKNANNKNEYDINFKDLKFVVHNNSESKTKDTLQEAIEYIITANIYKIK